MPFSADVACHRDNHHLTASPSAARIDSRRARNPARPTAGKVDWARRTAWGVKFLRNLSPRSVSADGFRLLACGIGVRLALDVVDGGDSSNIADEEDPDFRRLLFALGPMIGDYVTVCYVSNIDSCTVLTSLLAGDARRVSSL